MGSEPIVKDLKRVKDMDDLIAEIHDASAALAKLASELEDKATMARLLWEHIIEAEDES